MIAIARSSSDSPSYLQNWVIRLLQHYFQSDCYAESCMRYCINTESSQACSHPCPIACMLPIWNAESIPIGYFTFHTHCTLVSQ